MISYKRALAALEADGHVMVTHSDDARGGCLNDA